MWHEEKTIDKTTIVFEKIEVSRSFINFVISFGQ